MFRSSEFLGWVRPLVGCVVLGCLSLGLPWNAWGGDGGITILPSGGVKNRSGLRMEIDSRWVCGTGYRPVHIRIHPQPPGPAPADRVLEVRIRPRGWYQGSHAGAVSGTIELKQGSSVGQLTLSVPQTNTWSSWEIQTLEDGRRHWDLTTDSGFVGRYYNRNPELSPAITIVHWGATARAGRTMLGPWTSSPQVSTRSDRISTLFPETAPLLYGWAGAAVLPIMQVDPNPQWWPAIDSSAFRTGMTPRQLLYTDSGVWSAIHIDNLPDVRVLLGLFPEVNQTVYGNMPALSATGSTSDAMTESILSNVGNLDILAPSDLPDRWLDYTNIDVLIISRADLAELANSAPQKLKAMRTWLSFGPVLCVTGAGADFEHLAQFEQLLAVPALEGAGDKPAERRGWDSPNPKHFRPEVAALQAMNGVVTQWQPALPAGVPPPLPANAAVVTVPTQPTFLSRTAGQGRLVAIAAENPFPGKAAEWGWLFNSIPSRHWLTYQRVGVSQYQDNDQFWNFLIEGIGRAPVKSFLALISLFVVVIGPINYFLLQRRRKLYLLLVTVPTGAMLVSAALFLFAIFSDGLGTRLRLRSYTELDSERGEYRTWSRQTYYAGLTPSGGMTFPAEAEVLPVDHRPATGAGSEDTSRHLVWGEDQHLVAGYFPPRTMSQFVILERSDTPARCQVRENPEGAPVVRNELGAKVERLVLRDSKGDLYEVLELENNQETSATRVDLEQRGSVWNMAYRTQLPQYPPNFDPSALDDVSSFFSVNYRPFANTGVPPTLQASMMEVALANLHDGQFSGLRPREFVAVVARSPFVSRGVSEVVEERGTHTIVGRWRPW